MTPDEWKEAQRPGFEAWARPRFPDHPFVMVDGVYASETKQSLFEAWLAAKAEPVEVTEEMVEWGAAAMKPNLFSDNEREAHFAASPTTVDHARHISRTLIARILSAALNPVTGTEGENG